MTKMPMYESSSCNTERKVHERCLLSSLIALKSIFDILSWILLFHFPPIIPDAAQGSNLLQESVSKKSGKRTHRSNSVDRKDFNVPLSVPLNPNVYAHL